MLNSLNKKYGSPQKAKMTGVRYRGGGIWYANGHKYELSRYYWGKNINNFIYSYNKLLMPKNMVKENQEKKMNSKEKLID